MYFTKFSSHNDVNINVNRMYVMLTMSELKSTVSDENVKFIQK